MWAAWEIFVKYLVLWCKTLLCQRKVNKVEQQIKMWWKYSLEKKRDEGQASLLYIKSSGEQLRWLHRAPRRPVNKIRGWALTHATSEHNLLTEYGEMFNLIVKGKETRSHHFGLLSEQRFVLSETNPLMLGRAEWGGDRQPHILGRSDWNSFLYPSNGAEDRMWFLGERTAELGRPNFAFRGSRNIFKPQSPCLWTGKDHA